MERSGKDETRSALDWAALAFCRLGVAGLSKRAPGTCGTALALALAPWLFQPLGWAGRGALLCALFLLGGVAGSRAERVLGKKDPGEVVVDELVGAWVAILPFAGGSAALLVCAFVLFRVFDILKPWPVNASEDWLPGGFGIMIDDVVGGAMAMAALLLARAAGLLDVPLLG